MYKEIIDFIRAHYQTERFIPLHEPNFRGREKEYLNDCIDSTFVSSVGPYVDRFEQMMADYTGASHAVAVTNGTLALHMSMLVAGVNRGDLVITQPLSFVATCNAISYLGATPLFIDVDIDTLGLSPVKLEEYLVEHTEQRDDGCYSRISGQRIAACVPMHTFGLPARIEELSAVCANHQIPLIEDAAESLGSSVSGKQTGTFGLLGTYSFNGNKTITCGGGGAIVTNDQALAIRAKHLTTQAKKPHRWEFFHDEIGYNYRLPNINAALACAQLERLEELIENKRVTAKAYEEFFSNSPITFIAEKGNQVRANYWLCSILLRDRNERDQFLTATNDAGVMTRPVWTLMNKLPMFEHATSGNLDHAFWLEDRVVNIPSSPILK